MGCGISKRKVAAKVDLILEDSGDPHFDSIFRELEVPLQKLTKARKKTKQAIKIFAKEVGTHKQLKNPTFFDSVMAMLFCFSASGEGNLENINFCYSQEPPFVTVNSDMLYLEHRKIVPAWNRVVSLAHKVPVKLAPLQEKIEAAIQVTSSKLLCRISS